MIARLSTRDLIKFPSHVFFENCHLSFRVFEMLERYDLQELLLQLRFLLI